jgi:hypothetical protein
MQTNISQLAEQSRVSSMPSMPFGLYRAAWPVGAETRGEPGEIVFAPLPGNRGEKTVWVAVDARPRGVRDMGCAGC